MRVEEVRAMLAEGKLQLIDTRPTHLVSRHQEIAEGVVWRDPELVGEWMGELSKEKPVACTAAMVFMSAAAPRLPCAMQGSMPAI
jgi:hypothetical protein